MSFNPPYFLTLTGAAPGMLTQYDGSKYLYNPDDPSSSDASNSFIIVLIAIIMVILVIVLGVGTYVYKKRKATKI